MTGYLLVAAGGAVGAGLRFAVDRWAHARWSYTFPWAILAINLVGSLILGVITGALLSSTSVGLLVGTGFCGALTTYSTLSFETFGLWERGFPRLAVANLLGSATIGVAAAALGYVIGSRM